MPLLSVTESRDLIRSALTGSGLAERHAGYFTEAILDTELSGLEGHGFYWLQYYCQHLRSGKVDGEAEPQVTALSPIALRVDARHGFAHPAIEAGFARLIPAARTQGIAAMGVFHSYNAATLGFHTGTLARAGLFALGATNAVPTVAPVGGNRPIIGTNPISYAVPAPGGGIAFLVDQSATAVAWTAVKRAAEAGMPIPPGWALDTAGQPTTNATAGLAGSMAPAGGIKGFSIGLLVEVLCAALAGGRLGPEQGSFTEDDGQPIDNGQFFIAIDPQAFSGGTFDATIARLVASIIDQPGARLPNARREANKRRLAEAGLFIDDALLARLRAFA
jgi:(2R)-3-sulfolactate dehydrogenase (NADP+)